MSHLRSWWQTHPWRSSLLLLAVAAGVWQLWFNPLRSYWDVANAAALALSPDGRIVAVAGGPREDIKLGPSFGLIALTTVELRRTSDGQVLQRLKAPAVQGGAFSPDGRLLATGGMDMMIRVWLVSDGTLRQSLAIPARQNQHIHNVSFSFSPDGQWLAAGSTDGLVRVWRVADGTPLATLAEPAPVYEVAWSPDGQYLAVAVRGIDDYVNFWQIHNQRPARKVALLTSQQLTTMALSPDGQYLAVALQVHDHGEVQLWPATTSATAPLRVWRSHNWIFQLTFSPDSTLLAASGEPIGQRVLYRVPVLEQLEQWIEPDTITLWSVDKRWFGWPVQTIWTPYNGGPIFSPDGQTLVTSGWNPTAGNYDNGQVCFWQVAPRAVFWSWGFWVGVLLLLVRIWRDHFIWSRC